MDAVEDVRSRLEGRPDLVADLEAVLDVDRESDGRWSFEDVPVDSGSFGELVECGAIERANEGYRVANPKELRAVIDGDGHAPTGSNHGIDTAVELPSRARVVAVGSVLLLAFLLRTVFTYAAVFRGGDIVLTGNDPYFYRYWIEVLLVEQGGFSFGALGTLTDGLLVHDVLTFVVMWALATVLGATAGATGLTLAWYPVVAGIVSVYLVYATATRLTDDRRVGVASGALLAATPVHAYRTGLGFGDHHALDYLLVSLVLWSLVVLTTRAGGDVDRRDSWVWVAGVVHGVGVAGLTLSARIGPLFLLPVGVAGAAWAVAAHRSETDGREFAPFVGALALAGCLSVGAHYGLGWVEGYRAFAPVLLFAGVCAVLVATKTVQAFGGSAPAGMVASTVIGSVVAVAAYEFVPDVSRAVEQGMAYFGSSGSSGIAETMSLFNPANGGIFAPVLLFGFVFFLAAVYVAWGARYAARTNRPEWAAVVAFTLTYLGFAVIQSRFAGPLSIGVAVFAGLGFVHVAAWVDATAPPTPIRDRSDGDRTAKESPLSIPDGETTKTVVLLFLLVASLSFVQIPLKNDQLAAEESVYEGAVAADEYAAGHGIEYPQNYVLSEWGRNRVYNYFVNGNSRSYGYARATYLEFISSTNASAWTDRLRDRPVGFVVTDDIEEMDSRTMYARLHENLGSRSGDVPGLGRYRLVYASSDGTRKVWAIVDGYRVPVNATPGETVTVRKRVSVDGTSFEYVRTVTVDANGTASIVVPYPGTYTAGDTTVTVGNQSTAVSETDELSITQAERGDIRG